MDADRPPNILMIVTDQERIDVLGSYGSPICETPNLDQLAAEGVRFETCVTPTAICSPSRASMLTGLFPHGHGILNNTHEPDALRTQLPTDIATFPELLRDAGYRLGFVGKWHVGRQEPTSRGFHDTASVPDDVVATAGQPAIVPTEPVLRDPIYAEYPHGRLLIAGVDPRPIEETETRADADGAIDLLERYAALDAPFCLRLDFEGPHHPYMPPEPFASMYDAAVIPPWPNFEDPTSNKPAAQRRLIEQRGVSGWTWADWRPAVARYFGFMSFIDDEIGRVLRALDRLGLHDSTVVIHTTDHGDMTGSHGGQFNKGPLMYDEIYRVPLIVSDPRRGVVGVCRAPVSTVAVMPTILELAGLPRPPGLHVASLASMLADPGAAPVDGAAFAEYHGEEWGLYSQRMVRTVGAKYVYSPHGTDELYDLTADPHELLNLIDDPSSAALLAELRTRLITWMTDTDDPLALWARRLL
jgi:arylsulfatase A-like enzyme